MVASALVSEKVESGRKLLELLDASDFPLKAAYWQMLSDGSYWRLFLATPLVDELGSAETYRRVQQVLSESGDPTLAEALKLWDITVLSPNNRIAKLIRKTLKASPISRGVWFIGNAIDGTFIDDAYVYRAV